MKTPPSINDDDERQLGEVAKRLLATPHKPRSESKIGKTKSREKVSGPKDREPSSSKPKTV